VKETKTFDCVEMKRRIQEELQAEVATLGEQEARRRQWQSVLDDPLLGPLVRNKRPEFAGTTPDRK